MSDSPKKYGHWTAGAWLAPEQGHYPITDPATEETVGHAPEGHAAEVWAAAEAARDAFDAWSRTEPGERAAVLERIGALISERADMLVPLMRAESGATARVARSTQVSTAAGHFHRYALGAREPDTVTLAPHPAATGPQEDGGPVEAVAVRRPLGVVACITSHNLPLADLAAKIAPALALGNTVVVKPAPEDPLGCLELGPVMQEAGLPDGVFNVVTGSGPITVEALVAHYDIDMVSFAGSVAEGRRIAVSTGAQSKRTLLDLGGRGTVVVLEGADEHALKSALAAAGSAFTLYSGQIRATPARLLVHRTLYERSVAALAAHAEALTVGNPAEDAVLVGPLISAARRDRFEAYVETAVQQGARIAAGGERPLLKPGFYVAPTVLADVTPDMTAAQEAIAGPVVAVIPFDDEDEAVRIVTDAPAALHDHVFSADTARARHVAARLNGDNVGVNTAREHPGTHTGGPFGLHAYSELRSFVRPS
ncbi:aldehyde dehydrogenase family protein [Streptomyces sp. NPDC006296]|uniref:aldehyde dehydrogenase family protein n=1 Tax=Streptomyces sp. NPDC006296 TaxID=3156746 RepID=UPI0033B57257